MPDTSAISKAVRPPSPRRSRKVAAQRRTGVYRQQIATRLTIALAGRQQALLKGPRFGHFGFEPLQVLAMIFAAPAQLDAPFDQGPEHLAIEGLLNEVEGRAADGPDQLLVQIVDAARSSG